MICECFKGKWCTQECLCLLIVKTIILIGEFDKIEDHIGYPWEETEIYLYFMLSDMITLLKQYAVMVKIYFREERNMESNVPYIEIVPHQCEEECATCNSASKGNM